MVMVYFFMLALTGNYGLVLFLYLFYVTSLRLHVDLGRLTLIFDLLLFFLVVI